MKRYFSSLVVAALFVFSFSGLSTANVPTTYKNTRSEYTLLAQDDIYEEDEYEEEGYEEPIGEDDYYDDAQDEGYTEPEEEEYDEYDQYDEYEEPSEVPDDSGGSYEY